MANILLKTEQLNDTSEWTASDGLTVTANTNAAPDFAGASASQADRLTDASAVNQCGLDGAYHTIANDTSDWTYSIYVRKDTVTTRYPLLFLQFENGTVMTVGASFDTVGGTSAAASGFTAPDASGVVDAESLWWRCWIRHANNGTGNNAIRARIHPAHSLTLGAAGNNSAQGSIDAWGANLTNSTSVMAYEPEPYYSTGGWTTLDATLSSSATTYSDTTVEGGVEYEYRILAVNAIGSTPSNIDSAIASAGAGSAHRLERGGFRGMFRGMGL
jgi:hypothetical protein